MWEVDVDDQNLGWWLVVDQVRITLLDDHVWADSALRECDAAF